LFYYQYQVVQISFEYHKFTGEKKMTQDNQSQEKKQFSIGNIALGSASGIILVVVLVIGLCCMSCVFCNLASSFANIFLGNNQYPW
jgi:hypothetical protein